MRLRPLLPYLLLIVVELGAILVIGAHSEPDAGFPLDDAWIHQAVARNFAESGALGWVPHRFGSGATSILWALLLSLGHWTGLAEPPAFAFIVNSALMVMTSMLLLRMASRDGLGLEGWCFVAASAMSANYVWLAFSGMESVLSVFFLVLALTAWTSEARSASEAWLTGGTLAALVLTRPESLALAAVLLATRARFSRRWRHVGIASGCLAGAVVLYVVFTFWSTGQPGPSTLAGRRWMWFQHALLWPWLDVRGDFLGSLLDRLWQFTLNEPPLSIFWMALGLAALGAARLLVISRRLGTLVALTAVQLATYFFLLPTIGHGGRYVPLALMLFVPLIVSGGSGIITSLAAVFVPLRRIPRFAALGSLLPWAPALAGSLQAWSVWHALAVRHVTDTEVAMGARLARLPDRLRVASFDIGGIGYFSRRPILDLGGLSDPSIIGDIRTGRLWARLEREQVDILVMPMGYGEEDFPDHWSFYPRLGLVSAAPRPTRLWESASPRAVWVPGLRATWHCAPRQIAFDLRPGASSR